MRQKVESETRLELRIIQNQKIRVQGEEIALTGRRDAAVLLMVTTLNGCVQSEEIVAVTLDPISFLKLLSYVRADGGITLHRDLG